MGYVRNNFIMVLEEDDEEKEEEEEKHEIKASFSLILERFSLPLTSNTICDSLSRSHLEKNEEIKR